MICFLSGPLQEIKPYNAAPMSLVVFGSRQPRFVLRGEFAHPVFVHVFSCPHGTVLLVLTLTLTRRPNTNALVAQKLSAQK